MGCKCKENVQNLQAFLQKNKKFLDFFSEEEVITHFDKLQDLTAVFIKGFSGIRPKRKVFLTGKISSKKTIKSHQGIKIEGTSTYAEVDISGKKLFVPVEYLRIEPKKKCLRDKPHPRQNGRVRCHCQKVSMSLA